jgi:nucleotide-binding universal stress UspA family protein
VQIRTILHPTDYDEPSNLALRYAVELAHDYKAKLIILHSVATLGPEKLTYGEAQSGKEPKAYRQKLWAEIHKIRSSDPEVVMEYVLSEDEPVAAITHLAGQRQCDLVVLGSHGRLGLNRLLGGSVAELVVRRAPCPVLVVKNALPNSNDSAIKGTNMHPRYLTEN